MKAFSLANTFQEKHRSLQNSSTDCLKMNVSHLVLNTKFGRKMVQKFQCMAQNFQKDLCQTNLSSKMRVTEESEKGTEDVYSYLPVTQRTEKLLTL
jgi:hypothetical protein